MSFLHNLYINFPLLNPIHCPHQVTQHRTRGMDECGLEMPPSPIPGKAASFETMHCRIGMHSSDLTITSPTPGISGKISIKLKRAWLRLGVSDTAQSVRLEGYRTWFKCCWTNQLKEIKEIDVHSLKKLKQAKKHLAWCPKKGNGKFSPPTSVQVSSCLRERMASRLRYKKGRCSGLSGSVLGE